MEKTSWKFGEIEAIARSERCWRQVQSVGQINSLILYNTSEFKKLSDQMARVKGVDAIFMVLKPNVSHEYYSMKLEMATKIHHSISLCHQMCDIFSQVVNALMVVNKAKRAKCGMKAIRWRNFKNENVKTAVNELIDSYEFRYIDALTNTYKHHELVRSVISNTPERDYNVMVIESFKRGKDWYKKTEATMVLEIMTDLATRIVKIGIMINKELVGNSKA